MESTIDNFEYVETANGRIHRRDIPMVIDEPLNNKINKSLIFFSIIIIIVLIFVYMANKTVIKNKIKKEKIFMRSNKETFEVLADSIEVYNENEIIDLENIVLIESSNNVINIDIRNVSKTKKGQGVLYSFDFEQELNIKEIILISSEFKFISFVNIDLYNEDVRVWEFSDYLNRRKENSIYISKDIYVPDSWQPEKLTEVANPDQKIVKNENELFLKITEFDENYC